MSVLAVVCSNETRVAILFEPIVTIPAALTGIDHASNADHIANREALDFRAYCRDLAHNFVPRNNRISGGIPFVTNHMQVRMADATKQYIELNIVRHQLAALNAIRL